MKTDKKKISITLTTREAEWLYARLETIITTNRVASATPRMLEDAFQAKSLQERIDSEC